MSKVSEELKQLLEEEKRKSEQYERDRMEEVKKRSKEIIRNKGKKLLYYENNLNEENKFRRKIQFKNVDDSEFLNFLCRTEREVEEFMGKNIDKENIFPDIWELRGRKLNNGIGQDITEGELNEAVESNNLSQLHILLQDLFQEYIAISKLNYLFEEIEKGLTMKELINYHNKYKEERFLCVIKTAVHDLSCTAQFNAQL